MIKTLKDNLYALRSTLCARKGFTIIELTMVIVLLAIISFSVYQVLSIGFLTWQKGEGQSSVRQDARRGLDLMVRNIRQGRSLSILDSDSISFNFDYDVDGDNDSFEYYRNSFDSTLREEINNQPPDGTIISSGVSSLSFGWGSGSLNNILLNIQISVSNSRGDSSTLQTAVLPRSTWQ